MLIKNFISVILVGNRGKQKVSRVVNRLPLFDPDVDLATGIVEPHLLDFIDEQEIARKIRTAVSDVVQEGNIQTYDMAKMAGRSEVIEKGAASTTQMADAIIDKL